MSLADTEEAKSIFELPIEDAVWKEIEGGLSD